MYDDKPRKTERLIRIWVLLLNRPYVYKARDLAEMFNVNVKTIYRDLDILGVDFRLPITEEKARWGITESEFLPPIQFSLPEALNIFLAARLMLGYSQHYDPNIEATFTKLNSVLPPPLKEQVSKTLSWMQKLTKDERRLRIMATVAEAWVSQRRLKIVYRPLVAEKAWERVIDPYYIEPAAPGRASYVIGYCHLKDDIRTFKIERIESAELTADSYTIPSNFDANKYLGSSWGIVVDGEVKTVRLRIRDEGLIRIMEETTWHPSQVLEKQKDGSLLMTLRVADTIELYSWIMGWGEKVEVLEPPELREEVFHTAKSMVKVYQKK